MQRAKRLAVVLFSAVSFAPLASAGPATTKSSRSPVDTLKAWVGATHDPDPQTYKSVVVADGEAEQRVLDTASQLIAASAAFRQSALKSFGDAEVTKYNLRIKDAALPLSAIPGSDNANVTVQGDFAVVSDPGSSKSIELRRVDGEWRIPRSQIIPAVKTRPDLVQKNLLELQAFADVLHDSADDIDTHHLRTAEEAAVLVKLRLTRKHEAIEAMGRPKGGG